MDRVTDMTKGKPIRLIFFFSLPLMFGGMFQQLYMIVDTMIVGRGVGIQALTALGAADWINWMVLWTIQGLTQGFSVLIAQEFGANHIAALRKTLAMIVKLCLLFGIFITAASLLAAKPLLLLLKTDPTIIGGSQTYLYVQFSGTLVIIAYNMASAVLRCLGDSRTPLLAIVIASVANIVLDLLFVLVFHWGIFGAAVATVIAQFFSFLFCVHAMRKLEILQMQPADWQNDRAVMRQLCRLGIPTALQNGIIAIGGFVVQYVLNGLGLIFVAGFTATNKIYGILESAAIAFGYAMTAYMGQNCGAGLVKRIDAGMRSVLMLCAGVSAVISVTMILFGRYVLQLFVSAREASAQAVLDVAYQYLFVMSCVLILLFLVHTFRSCLQGLGNPTIPMLSGFIELGVRICVALLLPRLIGASGIFFAEVAAWAGAVLLMVIYYYANIKAIKRGILCSQPRPAAKEKV